MKLSPTQSLAGILEPTFAIRTEEDLGIGDTEGVRQMIDWCHRHGLNVFQTLPINELGDEIVRTTRSVHLRSSRPLFRFRRG